MAIISRSLKILLKCAQFLIFFLCFLIHSYAKCFSSKISLANTEIYLSILAWYLLFKQNLLKNVHVVQFIVSFSVYYFLLITLFHITMSTQTWLKILCHDIKPAYLLIPQFSLITKPSFENIWVLQFTTMLFFYFLH